MAAINARRGLNRIYLVLTVVWCLFVLWFPSKTAQEDYDRHEFLANAEFDNCNYFNRHAGRPPDEPVRSQEECENERRIALGKAAREDTYVGTLGGYLQLFWILPAAFDYSASPALWRSVRSMQIGCVDNKWFPNLKASCYQRFT